MSDSIRERNHTNAELVGNHFLGKITYIGIRDSILERNLTVVVSLGNLLIQIVI